jgi:predicted SAM-dependent methyltransferase
MKLILKIFPRVFLINLSIFLQPLLSIIFKGSKFTDPINGKKYSHFLSYGYNKLRSNALCPGTLSLERHRLLWLYLNSNSKIENQKLKVLHVAPEQVFFKKFKKFNSWTYTTTDLNSPLADVKANLCNLPFKDECFDLILCNHVLEHIVDDIKAMEEIYRVLKPKGKAIIQVPLNKKKKISYENYEITDPKERSFHFGQYDHVRIYGMDFFERLSSVGFKYEKVDFTSTLTDEEIIKYGLIKGELIPVGWK